MDKLLTREQFSKGCLIRDKRRCVNCQSIDNVHVHHLIERKLWSNGGYYLDNGVSVCESCHLMAESTELSCDRLRELAGIDNIHLPEHFDKSETYDKWGNQILPSGQRVRGELFDDESVQRILAPCLHLFTSRIKYPRTYHLPWSPGKTTDDKSMKDPDSVFAGKEIVITEKLDGENSTLYHDYLHARSLDSASHPSRDRLKALHASIANDIPLHWRICGENLYAAHSIHYDNLPSYFMMFSVWNDKNICLSWDETVEWALLLGLSTVPVLYRGPWDQKVLDNLNNDKNSRFGNTREGYVVRITNAFHYRSFRNSAAKYVRANHVTTGDHWSTSAMTLNGLI